MASITYPKGNIFDSNSKTLVNTVNCVGVMGKGIALEYKLRYPEMFLNYRQSCEQKELFIGKLQLWKSSDKWILNFPTKIHYKDPSQLIFIEKGLKEFVNTYKQKGIISIAFPQLGSSLGGLDWEREVHPLMLKYLSNLDDLNIEIYSYDPEVRDNNFLKFLTRTNRYQEIDFIKNIGISKNQALIIMNALEKEIVKNTIGFQNLKGIGMKTLEKIHEFIALPSAPPPNSDKEPTLFDNF